MKAAFGIAIVGTGIMGGRMLAVLKQQERFRVVSMFDVDRVALNAMVDKAPGARAAASVDELVNDPAVDIVYIATPPATHRHYVEAALAAGRACLCEKPLAADVEEAQVVRDVVVHAALPFAINFPLASAPASRSLLALVRDGSLGEIRHASITTRFAQWPRPWQVGASAWLAGAAEGGFTREVLSHFVFLSQRLFGPAEVTDVQLTREPGHSETSLRARLVHAKTSVTIDAAVAGEVADQNRFEIVGTKGSAALVDWSRLEFNGKISDRVDATPGTLDRLALMLDGHADHDLATVDEGLAVVRCIEAMLRS
jgi:predicted dehydrogenase